MQCIELRILMKTGFIFDLVSNIVIIIDLCFLINISNWCACSDRISCYILLQSAKL